MQGEHGASGDRYAKVEKGFVKLNKLFHDMTQNIENLAGVNSSLNRFNEALGGFMEATRATATATEHVLKPTHQSSLRTPKAGCAVSRAMEIAKSGGKSGGKTPGGTRRSAMKENREPSAPLPKSGGKTPRRSSLRTPKSSLKTPKSSKKAPTEEEEESGSSASKTGSLRLQNLLKSKLPTAFHTPAHLRQIELVLRCVKEHAEGVKSAIVASCTRVGPVQAEQYLVALVRAGELTKHRSNGLRFTIAPASSLSP